MLDKGKPYDGVPYFFSDQYEVGMEYAGYATRWDEVVLRGDPASREFIAFWLADGRVAAGMNVNVREVTDRIQDLIRSRVEVDPRRLADPDVPLDELGEREQETAAGLLGAAGRLLAQGANYPRRLIAGRLAKGEATPASELRPGAGKVLQIGREKLAVSRDEDGDLHALSPVCTHLGCVVEWNGAEGRWDCPCHGSRFRPDGSVIRGPAKEPLSERPLPGGPRLPAMGPAELHHPSAQGVADDSERGSSRPAEHRSG